MRYDRSLERTNVRDEPLAVKKRPALMGYQKIVHVVRMIFFLRQDAFEHDARRRILVAEIADEFAVVFNRDPLGNQVLFDHRDEVLRAAVLRGRTRLQSLRRGSDRLHRS